MKLIHLSILFLIIVAINVSAQDSPHSVGPAPVTNNVNNNYSPVFFDQVGTRAFTQIAFGSTYQFGRSFMESCAVTNIGAPFTIQFPGGLIYRNGVVYTYNTYTPFQLWSIDTVTGVHTLVFNMTGVPLTYITGMCWDGITMYGVSTSLTQSQIFTVNMTTGACTPIGVATAVCAGAINLMGRSGAQFSLFSCDIVADNLYKWNKTTGAVAIVGPITSCNYGQDGCVDPNDNTFYWMAYTNAPVLRRLDTATGTSVLLCTYLAQATGIACVPSSSGNVCVPRTFCRTGLNILIVEFVIARDSVIVPPQGAGCTVADVNVTIVNVQHTWVSDLRFYIQHLTTGSRIIDRVGGSGDNFINTILNDSAAIPIESGSAPFTGSYRPSSPLAPFNGLNPDGAWRIVITDSAGSDSGTLHAWCVVLCVSCPVGGIKVIEVPNYYSLNQNYPNPFNPTTTIKFGLPKNDNVKLTIYDVLGKEVIVLVNEYKTANTYEIEWDAGNFSSGIYFYKLETSEFISTKKMLLIK